MKNKGPTRLARIITTIDGSHYNRSGNNLTLVNSNVLVDPHIPISSLSGTGVIVPTGYLFQHVTLRQEYHHWTLQMWRKVTLKGSQYFRWHMSMT